MGKVQMNGKGMQYGNLSGLITVELQTRLCVHLESVYFLSMFLSVFVMLL